MKALSIVPGTKNLHLIDVSEPSLQADDEIKMQVLQVGICGTDREEAEGGRADAPPGHKELVIGHEMLGQVLETGKAVTRVHPSDLAVFTVRRGCGKCAPCLVNRSDMCATGEYRERGIKGLDGYQTERVVDRQDYVVHIPSDLASVGVLCEPLSVAEKAIAEAVKIQMARLPAQEHPETWLQGRRCLVAGLGPIGLLGALVLRLRGAQVFGLDILDASTARPQWLNQIGGIYVDGRQVQADQVDDRIGPMDLIFESTGVASLEFNLLDALTLNGLYVLTGIPGGDRPLQIPGAELIRQLVLDNQVMLGSVNAAQEHFQLAVGDLTAAVQRWPGRVEQLITHHYPSENAPEAILNHPPDAIKVVIDWASKT
jgi:threonine dehydrogenase-like Zn-dependent dehydrogenase